MKLPRFSIARLMGFVVVAAIGLGGLIRPEPDTASLAFTMTVVILTVAMLNAFHRSGRPRTFWAGFAATGWLYAALAFGRGFLTPEAIGRPPALIFGALTEKLQVLIHPELELIGADITINLGASQVVYAPNPVVAPAPQAPAMIDPAIPAIEGSITAAPTEDPFADPAAISSTPPGPAPTAIAGNPTGDPPIPVGIPAFSAMPAVASPILALPPFEAGICFQQVGQSLLALLAGLCGGYYAVFAGRKKDPGTEVPPPITPSSP